MIIFRKIKTVGIAIYIAVILTSCSSGFKVEEKTRPVKVTEIKLENGNRDMFRVPASLNELQETKLAFRVGGPIIMLNDVIGSYVKKGEVIARIDPRDFKIAYETTETQYKLANKEYERYKNLLKQESVSRSLFDKIEANYKLAKASFESAANALGDTELKSPFSGYINQSFTNNYQEIIPGHPVVSLIDLSKFEVKAWLSAKDISRISDSTYFLCVVDTLSLKGVLKEIGNKTSRSKQSYPITILVDAPDNIKLRAGITTYLEIVTVTSYSRNLIHVPTTSLFSENNKTYVWLYKNSSKTVTKREVKLNKIISNSVIEINGTFSGGERIVTAGVNYLFEGQKVKIMPAFTESNIGNRL